MIDNNSRIPQNTFKSTGVVQNRIVDKTYEPVIAAEQTASNTKISALSHQLSDAQARADLRDSSLDRNALASKASDIRSQLAGSSYFDNKAKHDAEVPNTNDPVHLERAKQATSYTNGQGHNPFNGLTPNQLSLVIYDEGGSFTMNEKRAALDVQLDREEAWRKEIAEAVFKAAQEENQKAMKEILREVLDHYENLPPIEHAQVDGAWLTGLKSKVGSSDFSQVKSIMLLG